MRIFIQTMTKKVRRKYSVLKWRLKSMRFRQAAPQADADQPAADAKEAEGTLGQRTALVKARPARLARRTYVMVDGAAEVDAVFFRLRDGLLKTLGIDLAAKQIPVGTRIRAEVGSLYGQRPYLFLDPWEESGWLMEKTPTGFLIAPADKIVERETFMRGNAWDIVNVFKPDGEEGLFRVSSERCGSKLMSVALYQDYLVKELKLAEYIRRS